MANQQLLDEFVHDQSPQLREWWKSLQMLAPRLVMEIGQIPVFDDAEYRRRGRDPRRPTYDVCDVQDFRDKVPGVWFREARRTDRLAEVIVARYYDIHQPLQPGLAKLLTRAVDAGDRRRVDLVKAVAAASQSLDMVERMLGMDLGRAYAVAGHRPCWAAPLKEGARGFEIADQEQFDRQEPYLFLVHLVGGLVEDHEGWQEIVHRTSVLKVA